MDDLIDMMVDGQSPSAVSDQIKRILMQKSAENIDIVRPVVAASVFGNVEELFNDEESDEESNVDQEEVEEHEESEEESE